VSRIRETGRGWAGSRPLAGGVAAGVVAVIGSAHASPRSGPLHATNECSQHNGHAGSFCTITSSNLRAIDVGSKVIYAEAAGAAGLDRPAEEASLERKLSDVYGNGGADNDSARPG
jgi:hypothetical protein